MSIKNTLIPNATLHETLLYIKAAALVSPFPSLALNILLHDKLKIMDTIFQPSLDIIEQGKLNPQETRYIDAFNDKFINCFDKFHAVSWLYIVKF